MDQHSLPTLSICLKQRLPLSDIVAQIEADLLLLLEESQLTLLQTLQDILPYNPYYVKRFLGKYISLLEVTGSVCEELYELYCDSGVLNANELAPTAQDLLEYVIGPHGLLVKVFETPKVISGAGTTGLRTWEAALFLLNFLNRVDCSIDMRGKRIVELGAGTGLVALALLKNYSRHRFSGLIVTDGNTSLLSNFKENMDLNTLDFKAEIRIDQLIWGSSHNHISETEQISPPFLPKADIALGADVTYDALVVPLLCETISTFLVQGTQLVLIAATIRNTDTIQVWEEQLSSYFKWRIAETLLSPHSSRLRCWFKKGTPEIRIYEISSVL